LFGSEADPASSGLICSPFETLLRQSVLPAEPIGRRGDTAGLYWCRSIYRIILREKASLVLIWEEVEDLRSSEIPWGRIPD
jgi:hypothetical protein